MSGKYRSQEELPGDFQFKIAEDEIVETGDDDTLSIATVVLVLSVAFVVSIFLFIGTISLHSKMHLFVFAVLIGAWTYNWRIYGKPPMGASYLDSYCAFSIDSESGMSEELGRFGKWRRLMWSIGEPPNPEYNEPSGEEPARGLASVRTLIEWVLIGVGVIWSSIDFGRYYFATDGPYFYDIFGHYMLPLCLGLFFWMAVWLKHRINDEWDEIRRHVEALNFFVCRWLIGYLLIWCAIVVLWIADS